MTIDELYSEVLDWKKNPRIELRKDSGGCWVVVRNLVVGGPSATFEVAAKHALSVLNARERRG